MLAWSLVFVLLACLRACAFVGCKQRMALAVDSAWVGLDIGKLQNESLPRRWYPQNGKTLVRGSPFSDIFGICLDPLGIKCVLLAVGAATSTTSLLMCPRVV